MRYSLFDYVNYLIDTLGILFFVFIFLALFVYYDVYGLLISPKTSFSLERINIKIKSLIHFIKLFPLIGLLGTIMGIIKIFSNAQTLDKETLSFGISQALLSTELGLVFAIPLIVVWAIFAYKYKERSRGR